MGKKDKVAKGKQEREGTIDRDGWTRSPMLEGSGFNTNEFTRNLAD